MTTPTYFTVVADFKSVVVDLASDVDPDPQLGPVTAKVTFTPVLANGDVILATNASPRPTIFVPAPIVARIDTDGRLKLRVDPDGDQDSYASTAAFPATGNTAKVYWSIAQQKWYRWTGSAYAETYPYAPVRLLADTALLELDSNLYYRAAFSEVVYNGAPGYINSFTFEAPSTDIELNLVDVARIPGQPAAGITKGDKGDQGYSFVGLAPAGDGTSVVGLIESAEGVVQSGEPIPISLAYNSTVTHGTDASTIRPPVSVAVIWIGSVQPTNAIDGDVWMDTSGTAPTITTTTLSTLNVGIDTDQTLLTSGTTPIVWTVSAGTLPAGLQLSSAGNLFGRPTTAAAYNFTVTATNGYGTDTQNYTGSVGAAITPTITTTSLGGTPTEGISYSQIIATTGSLPLTFSVNAGSLPADLELNTSTGLILGTPAIAGAYSFTIRATNSAGYDDQAFSGSITGSPPNITSTSLDAMSQGAAFSMTPAYTGTDPITWAISAGSLPGGLAINSSTGQIYGTPSSSGSYSFTVSVTNSYGSDTQAFTGTVSTGTASITTTNLGTVYRAVSASVTLSRTGASPITFAVQTGSLPTGLSLNTSTGVISGTPSATGAYSFTIRAANTFGYDDQAFSGSVLESTPAITETTINSLVAGTVFSQTLNATGYSTMTWSVFAGTLPAGLTLNSSTGTISGTPTTSGAYDFTIRATNSIGYGSRQYTGNVANPVVTYDSSVSGKVTTSPLTLNTNAAAGSTGIVFVAGITYGITGSLSATYNGASLTQIGTTYTAGPYNSAYYIFLAAFKAPSVAGGPKNVVVTAGGTVTELEATFQSYNNVTTVGSLQSTTGSSTSLTQTVTSATNRIVAQAFFQALATSLGSYNATQRGYQSGRFLSGDAPGAASVTITASRISGSNPQAYAGIAVDLIP